MGRYPISFEIMSLILFHVSHNSPLTSYVNDFLSFMFNPSMFFRWAHCITQFDGQCWELYIPPIIAVVKVNTSGFTAHHKSEKLWYKQIPVPVQDNDKCHMDVLPSCTGTSITFHVALYCHLALRHPCGTYCNLMPGQWPSIKWNHLRGISSRINGWQMHMVDAGLKCPNYLILSLKNKVYLE